MLTVNNNQYQTTKFGDHEFAEIAMADFITVEPAPIQRDGKRRLSTMKPIFNDAYASNQAQSLTEVVLGRVDADFDYCDKESGAVIRSYHKGELYVLDGNTRRHYWIQNPDRAQLHTVLTAKVHSLKSRADVDFAYYPYNNKASVEKASHLLQGLARNYNWTPKQSLFAGGGYKTALDWACDSTDSVEANFHALFSELKVLDSIPRGDAPGVSKPNIKQLKSQPIIAAMLMMLKKYPNDLRVFSIIEVLCSMTYDDLKRRVFVDGRLRPLEVIATEWAGLSNQRTGRPDATPLWLNGIAGASNFASREPQLDFLLYWMEKHLDSPAQERCFTKGIKDVWTGYLSKEFNDE